MFGYAIDKVYTVCPGSIQQAKKLVAPGNSTTSASHSPTYPDLLARYLRSYHTHWPSPAQPNDPTKQGKQDNLACPSRDRELCSSSFACPNGPLSLVQRLFANISRRMDPLSIGSCQGRGFDSATSDEDRQRCEGHRDCLHGHGVRSRHTMSLLLLLSVRCDDAIRETRYAEDE